MPAVHVEYMSITYKLCSCTCSPAQDGVYMDEVVEVCVGALHLLARTPANRQTMRQLNCIRLFVQVSM